MILKPKHYSFLLLCVGLVPFSAYAKDKTIDQKVDELMAKMTLEEKVGQLNQYSSSWATGPVSPEGNKMQEVQDGKVGSLLNVKGVEKTRAIQEIAMKSRLKIPLIFGLDVIHGYKTTFPIPLAEAASWDLGAMEQSARVAAVEASASGIHWTFAPMVDIARDPRWGRVMEGAGEDTYLGCAIAKARVHGFQGNGLGNTDAIMACAKHFAAYGAAIGGRDYNAVDISPRTLLEVYLPPFKAAVDAGAATFMNSFNSINGVPATGNAYIQRELLKGQWGFKGFVVSDWGSIGEMVAHGYAADAADAAVKAITAGSDMDMESRCYPLNLAQLVRDGKVSENLVNDACRRVLVKKFELGLFDDPYRFCNAKREKQALNDPQHRAIARDVARKSIVLLKNDNNILPLTTDKKIALIGPLGKSKEDMLGFWNVGWEDNSDVVSQFEGLENRVGKGNLLYAKGCGIDDLSKDGFAEAVEVAKQADVVILTVGERRDQSGEAKSRASIEMSGVQEDLIKAVCATGKPVIVMINAGRPLVFNWVADHAPAILYTWWLGSEAGNAIADVVFGDYNPAGKLPMSFPRSEGQIPVNYNYTSTGRPAPANGSIAPYTSGYIDMVNTPKFPFGFGLSYTTFKYDNLKLSANSIHADQTIDVSFTLTNTGKRAGEEVAQMYVRDLVASSVRPVKELKDFQKVLLEPGESKTIHFTINKEKLSFFNNNLEFVAEPGDFSVMVGASSSDIRLKDKFILQ